MIENILHNYDQFMNDSFVRGFVASGGRVFIASENRSASLLKELCKRGHRFFAEKYVQEASSKLPALRNEFSDIQFNFFGHLQQNKAKKMVRLFESLESLDRPELAFRLRKYLDEVPECLLKEIFIQINIGREPQKTGVLPENAKSLIDLCRDLQLPIKGLMAIPPKNENPLTHFKYLRKLADQNSIEGCQMGMSNDFREAIKSGATDIRIGRIIFENANA